MNTYICFIFLLLPSAWKTPKDMTVFFVRLLFPLCTRFAAVVGAIRILIPIVFICMQIKYDISPGHARQPYKVNCYRAVTFLCLGTRQSLLLKLLSGRLISGKGASSNHRIEGQLGCSAGLDVWSSKHSLTTAGHNSSVFQHVMSHHTDYVTPSLF